MLPNPTLDQLQVFVAIAETGSFSAAARRLNRAQSVISYTIGNLEAQLQLSLFERSGARQPTLTEAGRAVLEDAKRIIADLDGLRARTKALTEGLEPKLSVAVSVMVPDFTVMEVLTLFQQTFPTVPLHLTVGSPFFVARMVDEGNADIAIGGAAKEASDGVVERKIGHSFIVPVAAPQHRLAALGRRLSFADVVDDVQIVVTDSARPLDDRGFNIISRRRWHVSDMTTKHRLVLAGLGWGGVPLAMVRNDIKEGRLVRLDVEPYEQFEYPLAALWRVATPPGPAGRWLVDRMAERLSNCPDNMTDAIAHITSDDDPAAVRTKRTAPAVLREAV
ncbi:MAG: LysR family transcriptional regulator [Shinella sp.]|nr:MAG: LysR family transcriptional regulator [Shinella sp.]